MQTAQINISIDTQNAIKSIGELNNEIGDSIVTVRDLQMTVSALQEELETTEVGTERWKELKQAYIDANTELKNYELSVEALDNEQLATELKSVVGGLTDMAGGLALVGVANESMEKVVQTFAKVEAASRIVTGGMEALTSAKKLFASSAVQSTIAAVQETVAISAQAVAAGTATVAQKALNLAMKAFPAVAIIGAVVGLVAAFSSMSDEEAKAAEEAKKLKEEQEKLKKELKEDRSQLAKNSSEFVNYIYQLKQTNENSIERKDLIDKINSTYGTTLQNLADETEFQKQLNLAVDDYIANQKAKILLKRNEAKFTEQLNLQIEAEEKLANLTREVAEIEELALKQNITFAQAARKRELQGGGDILKYRKQLADAQRVLNDLAKEALDLQSEQVITPTEPPTTPPTTPTGGRTTDSTKEQIDSIQDILDREKSALAELEQIRIRFVEDDTKRSLELNELKYGEERDKLIETAIKREKDLLDSQYTEGLISEQVFRESINDLYERGDEYLLDIERQLLEEKKKIYEEEKNEILRLQSLRLQETKITLEQIDVLTQNTLNTLLEQEKEKRIFEAEQTIKDEKILQEELLKINKEYSDKEIQQITDTLKEEIDLRTAQYEKDLLQKELTTEQKKLIEEQYNNDIVNLNADAQSQIQDVIRSTVEAVRESTFELTEQQQLLFDSVVSGIQQSLDIMNQIFDEVAERASYRREVEYEEDTETLNQQLANRTLSEEQYNAKLAELDQKKAVEELKAKRRQFKLDKANSITEAIISTAQAVLAGLAAAPPPIGPILAGINGALGAVQIGVISSQQFRAARGGIVPGAPSEVDSVSSLLAPGEMVINSNSSQMYGGLLSTINELGGGVPLIPSTTDKGTSGGNTNKYEENNKQQPIKAYVVETEISDKQKKIRRIKENSEY